MRTVHHSLSQEDRPAMAALREAAAPAKGHPLEKAAFDELMSLTPAADGVTYRQDQVGGISGWWCTPSEASEDAAILYLHGGGYTVGSAGAYRNFVGQIAARAKLSAFVPEYRLAPEHRFPAAIEDAKAAYEGLSQRASSISILGDSAGGGLALILTSIATAASPRATVAMSPLTDLTLSGASMVTRADADPVLTKDVLAASVAAYLGDHDPADPLASPLFGHQSGLPPILIHVGEDEVLLDDSQRYAERLSEAGNPGEIHIWEGMSHVFPSSVGRLQAASAALDIIATFLNR